MRPIERGELPQENGVPLEFNTYQKFRGYLTRRLGSYCSYCERYLAGNIAVEHIKPKSLYRDKELSWDNFLLACGNCNSIKSNKDVKLEDYFWPDIHNTFMIFDYKEGGIISPSKNLTTDDVFIVQRTIKLTGLDRKPSANLRENPDQPDTRWLERKTVWQTASRSLRYLLANNSVELRNQIVETAIARGFFSVWMTVFKDDRDMLKRFLAAFPGTSESCFESDCISINRNK
ncbi:HNH endonuclease [Bacillus inaquosorum]|uniref:HNH endonuclease n=1 Tax=Bacillus inaquosorum TaxID=483913 RepID=UPI00227DAEF0|nr:HNH endonuclease [Bacillus inaquosorum]MCY8860343.1 HNH endonuclease [Bacillus inaquosorum]MCY8875854.1 HNH endonuclease [Bacillus inaquosorum]